MESVEKPVELQNVHARLAEKSELRRPGRLLNEGCDLLVRQFPFPRDARNLKLRRFRSVQAHAKENTARPRIHAALLPPTQV